MKKLSELGKWRWDEGGTKLLAGASVVILLASFLPYYVLHFGEWLTTGQLDRYNIVNWDSWAEFQPTVVLLATIAAAVVVAVLAHRCTPERLWHHVLLLALYGIALVFVLWSFFYLTLSPEQQSDITGVYRGFITRGAGFYVDLAVVLLALVVSLVHLRKFLKSQAHAVSDAPATDA